MEDGTTYMTHRKCLISGAEDIFELKGYDKDYLVKSKSSGFVFSKRIPTPEELIDHYRDYPRLIEVPELTLKRYHALLDLFEEYRKTGNLIDVGCGNGLFLNEAKKRGWKVYGTEFSDDAIAFCKSNGIKMKKGPLNSSNYEEGQFDIATSFEVIEHINNPVEEIEGLENILRRGGLLYITTPNFNCIERYVLGPKYNAIEYPEHLCYYTSKTLKSLIEQKGFKSLKVEAVNIDFAKIFKRESNTEVPGKINNDVRENFEAKPLLRTLKTIANFLLSKAKLGNALKGWFVKL